jgi:anti-sigma regulatory factor (Ser/Thr protein kinase)
VALEVVTCMRSEPDEAPRRCVLPFRAEPRRLGELRRTVSTQLKLWGVSLLCDQATLAVTELATNVIKHVGEGTAATLEVEVCDQRLRLEMHDTGPRLPTERHVPVSAESGRGLALLSAISDDWGARHHALGKSIWCELSVETPGPMVDESRRRVGSAAAALDFYRRESGAEGSLSVERTPVACEAATGLIADLMYWLTLQGCDPEHVLDCAQTRFETRAARAS